jgi:hypothetical protein
MRRWTLLQLLGAHLMNGRRRADPLMSGIHKAAAPALVPAAATGRGIRIFWLIQRHLREV